MMPRLHIARLLAVCLLAAHLACAVRPAGSQSSLHAAARAPDSNTEVQNTEVESGAPADAASLAEPLPLSYEHKSMEGMLL